MLRCCCLSLALSLIFAAGPALSADPFDYYTNPVLAKAVGLPEVKELKQVTPEMIADNDRVLPGAGALLIVQTNEGRFSKVVVQAARQKVDSTSSVPILLVDRYVTYREGQERAIQCAGHNVRLFAGFRLSLDIGQIVPAALGGDLHFVAQGDKSYVEPIGKARLFLVMKPVPDAAPRKTSRLVVGDPFEPRYFTGAYKLHDDGRRSGTLKLEVATDGAVSGSYYSDKDGQKYDVEGKIGPAKHALQFIIRFPRSRQEFQGWMFTGDGKAITGSSRMQERETGFYATRVEE
jgi:hypothetical protein